MKTITWLRKDWHLAPHAKKVLLLMSQQANFMGASVVGAFLAFSVAKTLVYAALVGWLLLSLAGALFEQPELDRDDGE